MGKSKFFSSSRSVTREVPLNRRVVGLRMAGNGDAAATPAPMPAPVPGVPEQTPMFAVSKPKPSARMQSSKTVLPPLQKQPTPGSAAAPPLVEGTATLSQQKPKVVAVEPTLAEPTRAANPEQSAPATRVAAPSAPATAAVAAAPSAAAAFDGWVTYYTDENVPYFYHAVTGTTSWDYRAPVSSSAPTPATPGPATPGAILTTVLDPEEPEPFWDLLLVLPLPEDSGSSPEPGAEPPPPPEPPKPPKPPPALRDGAIPVVSLLAVVSVILGLVATALATIACLSTPSSLLDGLLWSGALPWLAVNFALFVLLAVALCVCRKRSGGGGTVLLLALLLLVSSVAAAVAAAASATFGGDVQSSLLSAFAYSPVTPGSLPPLDPSHANWATYYAQCDPQPPPALFSSKIELNCRGSTADGNFVAWVSPICARYGWGSPNTSSCYAAYAPAAVAAYTRGSSSDAASPYGNATEGAVYCACAYALEGTVEAISGVPTVAFALLAGALGACIACAACSLRPNQQEDDGRATEASARRPTSAAAAAAAAAAASLTSLPPFSPPNRTRAHLPGASLLSSFSAA